MTGQDWRQHDLEYYDEKPKMGGEDLGAKRVSMQPVPENEIMSPESVERESDSSVAHELFGPMWNDVDEKDCILEKNERACDPVEENDASECTYVFCILSF